MGGIDQVDNICPERKDLVSDQGESRLVATASERASGKKSMAC